MRPHTLAPTARQRLHLDPMYLKLPLSSQKLRQNEVIMRISKQGSRTLAFSQHSGERTLVTAALAKYTRLQCPYILADGKGYQLQVNKRFIVAVGGEARIDEICGKPLQCR